MGGLPDPADSSEVPRSRSQLIDRPDERSARRGRRIARGRAAAAIANAFAQRHGSPRARYSVHGGAGEGRVGLESRAPRSQLTPLPLPRRSLGGADANEFEYSSAVRQRKIDMTRSRVCAWFVATCLVLPAAAKGATARADIRSGAPQTN